MCAHAARFGLIFFETGEKDVVIEKAKCAMARTPMLAEASDKPVGELRPNMCRLKVS